MNLPAVLRRPFVFLLVFASSLLHGQTDPSITSWVTARSYARVYETTSDKTSGNAVSTWPRSGLTNGGGGQATVVYSDVQRVVYSTNYVYVYVTGLPSYTTGNWLTPNKAVYTSWPTNRGTIQKVPRKVTIPTTKQANKGSGGVLVNGVFVWANGDGQSYNTSTAVVSSMGGQGIWNRLAGVAEAFNFDPAYGHQPNSGVYHNHINPIALRYQLGDNVTYNSATKAYAESSTLTKHSPLIGWANDGLPIYGPYGYSSALDSTSGIRRMTSGFVKRNSANATLYGTDDLAVTGRVKLPVWSASVQGKSQTLASTEYGPSTTASYTVGGGVTATYSVGVFAEDYEYLGNLGKTQGVDFDLNRQNVRYCVTPEFPSGTYAYFVSIDSSGSTAFPDIINQEYFGTAAMGSGTVTSISETVTEYVRGGQASPISSLTAAANGTGMKLTWTSVEGGTYTVASSPDGTTYTTVSSSVASGGTSTTYTPAALAPYFKVTLNAVATYDTTGNGGISGVGNSATVYYGPGGTAPSISTPPASQAVTTGDKVTFTVVAAGTATLKYQWKKGTDEITGETGSSYVIPSAALTATGTYSVVVTNDAGSATSADAVLTVTDAPPSITTPPASQTVTAGSKTTFTVVATGTATLKYQWKKNGYSISGATSASYSIASTQFANAASYTVVVTNGVGTATSAAGVLAVSVPTPSLPSPGDVPQRGPVSVTMTTGATVSSLKYYATGLPAGLSVSSSTGVVSGVISAAPGTYTVSYWAQYGTLAGTVSTVNIVVTAFTSTLVGTYEGVLEDTSGLPAGKVKLVVDSTGAFTGTLTTTDTSAHSFKGTLALDSTYSTGSKTVSVSRGTGLTAYSLTVSVTSSGVLGATVTDVGSTTAGMKLATYTDASPSSAAGSYTMTFGSPDNLGTTAAPAGNGYATATISSTGSLVAKGALADGTALSGTISVATDGTYFWYLKPYTTAGNYLAGWLPVTKRTDTTGYYQASSSDFYWMKPASATDAYYPAGFGPVALTVNMQKWVVPTSTTTLASLLGMASAGGNLSLVIDGAGLSNATTAANTYGLPTLLKLSSTVKISVANATNPTGFTLSISSTAGYFNGSFTLTSGGVSRLVSFKGAILQMPSPVSGTVIGRGYFLVPPVVSTDPTLSGELKIVMP